MTSSWAIASARAMTGRAPKASAWAQASVTASSTPSGFLGHADPGSTLRTYTHLRPSSFEGCRPTIDSAVRVLMCPAGVCPLEARNKRSRDESAKAYNF